MRLAFHGATTMTSDLETDVAITARAGYTALEAWAAKLDRYLADHPLADPSSAAGRIHGAPAVPNLTRITVQGSTNAPAEWLRLTIDPHAPGVFSWTNVPYCATPAVSCP